MNSFFRKNRPQFWRLRAKTGKLKLIFKQTWSSFFYLSGSTFFKLINISFKYRQIFLKLIIQCIHTRIKLIFNRKYHFNWPRLTTETDNNNQFLLLYNFPKIIFFQDFVRQDHEVLHADAHLHPRLGWVRVPEAASRHQQKVSALKETRKGEKKRKF